MSSDHPDLSKIQPPAVPPPEIPDPKTAAEADEYKKKPLSPLEREANAHQAHLTTKTEQIAYHIGEKEQLKKELQEAHECLTGERKRAEDLAIRCAQLEVTARSIGCMTALGTFMTVAGSILLGIAGAAPDLTPTGKAGLTWSGAAAAVCGGVLVLTAFITGWLTKTSKPLSPKN